MEMFSGKRKPKQAFQEAAPRGYFHSPPSVHSWTLAISWASWARLASSQKTAGTPVALARFTANCTQSLMGASWEGGGKEGKNGIRVKTNTQRNEEEFEFYQKKKTNLCQYLFSCFVLVLSFTHSS